MKCHSFIFVLTACLFLAVQAAGAQVAASEPLSADEAAEGLRKAVSFFRTQVGPHGGYVWRYSADLKEREGESHVPSDSGWIQPPGTPAVGEAYLEVYQLTGDKYYLDSARQTALGLVRTQLQSGGWDNQIVFDDESRQKYAYRADGRKTGSNMTTLDDDKTQSALRFLMRTDQALEFQEAAIHEAAGYALSCLLQAQYPNGGWAQRFREFPDPQDYPVKRASYPDDWPRQHPDEDYRDYYTLNDNTLADMIETMLLAAQIYDDPRYQQAAEKAGDFLLLAQMPDPQRAWAQQYNREMQPAWARRFEPPAVTGGESQGALQTLMELYRRTGKEKYLRAVPEALKYLKSSELPGGRLARFYELKTNRPLYFTMEYELTYEDDDLPTHYAFTVDSKVDRLQQQYQRLLERGPDKSNDQDRPTAPRWSESLETQSREVLSRMDDRGAWVEDGVLRTVDESGQSGRILQSSTFARNLGILARYVAARRAMER